MNTEKQATRKAKALLSKMKTKGWKIRVWENIGWHHAIYCGYLSIHEFAGKYNAMLSDDTFAGTPIYWSHGNFYKDPNKAVTMVMKAAEKFVKGCSDIIEETKKKLKEE